MGNAPILSARVILEACPPSLEDRDKAYAVLRQSFACYNSFDVVSVPDLQDEAEFRRTRERVPNEEFAEWLSELTGKPLSLYKVSVHCDRAAMEAWLERASRLGCRSVVLVGGDSSDKQYGEGALAVGEAASIVRDTGLSCGGIIIPTRREQFVSRPASIDEAQRLRAKIRDHGLSFFSTQILYESEWMCCLLLDLVRRVPADETPKIFLTFAPLVCEEDITFAKKTLGVYIPRDVENRLRGARSMRESSLSGTIGIFDRIFGFAREIGFPSEKLGVNVEYLDSRNPRNVDAAFELAEEFGRMFKRSKTFRR